VVRGYCYGAYMEPSDDSMMLIAIYRPSVPSATETCLHDKWYGKSSSGTASQVVWFSHQGVMTDQQ
jgi:hypothetical protein